MTSPREIPLTTERLTLRYIQPTDRAALLSIYGRDDVARYLPHEPWTEETADAEMTKRVARRGITSPGSGLSLAVDLDGQVIGEILLWPVDDTLSRGEIGWVFHPDAAGHGYATEAARELLGLAFDQYGMHRVAAQLDPRNVASARVCERLGMRHEAHTRQDFWSKGEWSDTAVYGILAAEWTG